MAEGHPQVSRLVTFLGIPQKPRDTSATVQEGYQLTTYRQYDGDGAPTERTFETPWIAVALAEFFEPSEAHVLATDEAWKDRPPGANRGNGEALAHELRCRGIAVERVPIPTGLSAAELWQQFDALKGSLRGPAERQIVLDITHGLRNQPFFTGAVVAFVSMIDEERPNLRVVYGAHDLIRTLNLDHAPIVELTPFVQLVDWTHDLVLFLKSGRLGRLIQKTRAPGRQLGKEWQNGTKLAQALETFAKDLQTIRTGSLLLGTEKKPSSARQLLEAVERARADVETHLPPLADVLDRIKFMAQKLAFEGDALVGATARDVLANLARLYVSMGRYIEALTTVRESLISLQGPAEIAAPGLPHYDHDRRLETEQHMRRRLGRIFDSIGQFRNDLDHAGYQKQPAPAATLIKEADRWTNELRKHQCHGTVFGNISNHPSAEWSEEQKKAACVLADCVRDFPFPEVPPDADPGWIEAAAAAFEDSLPPETTHALVQGEFTLTMALVKRLQEKGIRCLAATTERAVEKTEDGREVRAFRFVRFREYPKLT